MARNMQWITVPVYDLLVSWQAVVAVVGVYSLVRRHLVFGLILLGISAYYLNDQLSALCGTDMQAFMLPAILILIGIVTVFSHGGKSRNYGYGRTPEEFKTMNYTSADGFLYSENAFSGVRQVILDEMLKGGSIQTRFGGSIIDMRRTDIPVGETPLDVDCKFGGIELYVPADWTIKCLCSTFMGGYEDKRWEREENPQKVLVIRGTLSWSGLVVKNYTSYTGVIAKVDSCFGLAAAGCLRTRPFPVGVHRRWYMGFLVGRNGCNSAVCPVGLLGMVCSRLCPYFHYYAFYHYIRHILYFGGQFLYPVDFGVY